LKLSYFSVFNVGLPKFVFAFNLPLLRYFLVSKGAMAQGLFEVLHLLVPLELSHDLLLRLLRLGDLRHLLLLLGYLKVI